MEIIERWNRGAITIFIWIVTMTSSGQTQIPPNRPTFFEEGYHRMEREVQQLEQRSTHPKNSLLTIEAEEFKWQRLLSRDGQFSLWIPTGISTTQTQSISTQVGDLNFEVLSLNQPNSRFIVAYSVFKTYSSFEQAASVFEDIQRFIVADTGFKVESNRRITYEQSPAQISTLTTPDETIFLQMYWVQERVYVLGISQQKSVNLSQAANQFFNSFQVLP